MNTSATLSALKTLLGASFARVYIYPDDYASIPKKPTVPFITIEADPANLNAKAKYNGNCAFDSWQIKIEVYGAEGIAEYPSSKDATNRTAVIGYRDTIMGILDSNKTITNTVQVSGDEANSYTHAFAPLQWNRSVPYTGYVFLVPVQT